MPLVNFFKNNANFLIIIGGVSAVIGILSVLGIIDDIRYALYDAKTRAEYMKIRASTFGPGATILLFSFLTLLASQADAIAKILASRKK